MITVQMFLSLKEPPGFAINNNWRIVEFLLLYVCINKFKHPLLLSYGYVGMRLSAIVQTKNHNLPLLYVTCCSLKEYERNQTLSWSLASRQFHLQPENRFIYDMADSVSRHEIWLYSFCIKPSIENLPKSNRISSEDRFVKKCNSPSMLAACLLLHGE